MILFLRSDNLISLILPYLLIIDVRYNLSFEPMEEPSSPLMIALDYLLILLKMCSRIEADRLRIIEEELALLYVSLCDDIGS